MILVTDNFVRKFGHVPFLELLTKWFIINFPIIIIIRQLLQVLFEVARLQAPSTIFLDELDALASKRDGLMEHEGSRRLKTELLIQLDGLAQSDERIFLLATSNLPWFVHIF